MSALAAIDTMSADFLVDRARDTISYSEAPMPVRRALLARAHQHADYGPRPAEAPEGTPDTADVAKSAVDDAAASTVNLIALSSDPAEAARRSVVEKLKVPEQRQARVPTYQIVEQWEGRVTAIHQDEFDVELISIDMRTGHRKSNQLYYTSLPIAAVPPDDQQLFRVGALLVLSVGYEDRKGQRTRVIRTVFRRLPSLSRLRLREIDAQAALDAEFLKLAAVDDR